MRYVLFFLLITASLGSACAQKNEMKEHVILKFLPLGMFDLDNTFQLGVEVPIKNSRFSLQQEAGYGHSSFNIWPVERGNRPDNTTFKTRSQFRFYFFDKTKMRAYLAGEYLFKRVVHKDRQWVGQDCVNGACGYFENKDVRFGRFVNAGHVKFGWQFHFPKRMIFEVYTGFGLRHIEGRALTAGAENARLRNQWWWLSQGTTFNETLPSLAVGFQLGLLLGKLKPSVSLD